MGQQSGNMGNKVYTALLDVHLWENLNYKEKKTHKMIFNIAFLLQWKIIYVLMYFSMFNTYTTKDQAEVVSTL